MMVNDQLYTLLEVSEILKVTRRTLYTYVKRGDLKTIKIGKYHRVRRQDLQALLDKGIKPQFVNEQSPPRIEKLKAASRNRRPS